MEELGPRIVPATWPVNNLNANGQGSLDAAVTAANTDPNSANATINITVAGTISLTNPLKIFKNVNITTTAAGITVQRAVGAANFTIFTISSASSTCEFDNVTITGGSAAKGGGIYNNGTLTLSHCVLTKDSAIGGSGQGGGIYNDTCGPLQLLTVDVTQCSAEDGAGIFNQGSLDTSHGSNRIFSNAATRDGGGICNYACIVAGDFFIVHDNQAAYGGGIYNYYGNFEMNAGQIFSNQASTDGGGIWSNGTTTISNVSITNNIATRNGGAFLVDDGTTDFTTCTFTTNSAFGTGNCGYYLTGSTTLTGCTLQPPADYVAY